MVAAAGAYFFVVPRTVLHYVVKPGSVVVEMTGPGILDATNKVTITSRIPGFLNSISVDRNDLVEADQILAELDARDIQSQLEGSLADVDAAKSPSSKRLAIGPRRKRRSTRRIGSGAAAWFVGLGRRFAGRNRGS